ncbi:uncharacterized protein LOC101455597 isoform X2 [Ceratitis capitata]|uniref:(Mediterranean fruit fly) hypothetical protein n=1 Tax=Ceratitis capitata TaxID=7213 RepID=W8C140_CERCA|nr:uncharacterized protein LOC101455597 isoform X2 [Ceratitis capitata]CAD6993786.1 unnamed protein product [Ceratitis capitata]
MSISGKNLSLSPEADLDELIQDTSLLIASVYDMFGRPQRSPRPAQTILGRRSHNNSDNSGQFGSSSNTSNSSTPKSPKTPRLGNSNRAVPSTPSSREIDQEINRIDRFCEMLEHNLRSSSGEQNQMVRGPLGLASPTSPRNRAGRRSLESAAANAARSPTVEEVIDLCDSMSMPAPLARRALNLSDDVIIVTPTDDEIVDLCTPNHRRNTARTRNINSNRRSINFNGSTNNCRSGNESRPRMRASSRSLSSSNSSAHCSNEGRSSRCSISTTTSTTNINPSATAATKVASKKKSPGANCDDADDGANGDGRVPFMCAVCMESCVSNQPTSTKCGHVFCANCIRQAVRLTRKCPMCNTKLTANMLFRIYV